MEEPGFWDDADRATKLVQEAKNLKDTVDLYKARAGGEESQGHRGTLSWPGTAV